jgi:hypothetical protein
MRRGVPTVVLVTERFRELAEMTRRSAGMPDAPAVVLPATEATEYGGEEAMPAVAEAALRGTIEYLVRRREP